MIFPRIKRNWSSNKQITHCSALTVAAVVVCDPNSIKVWKLDSGDDIVSGVVSPDRTARGFIVLVPLTGHTVNIHPSGSAAFA